MKLSYFKPEERGHDLAVISCHFNFRNYQAPRANLRRFLRHMAYTGASVFGIELFLEHQEPVTTGHQGWRQIQVDDTAVLWQKEALLNAVAAQVPERFTKLAWIDADLCFNSASWLPKLAEKLNQHPIVQPFERCHWTNREGKVIATKESFVKTGMTRAWLGHPGFAMAAQRSFFEICGLYDAGVIGNGDTILAASLTYPQASDWLNSITYSGNFGLDVSSTRSRYESWAEKARAFGKLGKGVGFLEGIEVTHDWHGDKEDRQYEKRHAWMSGFDVEFEIERSPEGFLRWTRNACPNRVLAVKHYFRERREDGRSHPQNEVN